MFNRIWQSCLKWLSGNPTADLVSERLVVVEDGIERICKVTDTRGFLLVVQGENSLKLVSEQMAKDKSEFWRIWNQLKRAEVTWADDPTSPYGSL